MNPTKIPKAALACLLSFARHRRTVHPAESCTAAALLRGEVYAREKGWEPAAADGTERDGDDRRSVCVLASTRSDGKPVGTARLILRRDPDSGDLVAEISRLAVLREHRGPSGCLPALFAATVALCERMEARTVEFVTTESVIRKIRRFGPNPTPVGPAFELHGTRRRHRMRLDEIHPILRALARIAEPEGSLEAALAFAAARPEHENPIEPLHAPMPEPCRKPAGAVRAREPAAHPSFEPPWADDGDLPMPNIRWTEDPEEVAEILRAFGLPFPEPRPAAQRA